MKTLTRIKGMRFISLLMALAMVFVLVGCGSSGNTQPAVSQGTNGEITAAALEEGDSATAGFNSKAKNGGNKPFAGRVVSDLQPVYTFYGELPDE